MSRSDYIYLVLGWDDEPTAAFTVKYELRNWLNRYEGDLVDLAGYRMCDGAWPDQKAPVALDLEAVRDGLA